MAELQCSVLAKRKVIPAHGGWRLHNVQKHIELHDIYQGLPRGITCRGEFFSWNLITLLI